MGCARRRRVIVHTSKELIHVLQVIGAVAYNDCHSAVWAFEVRPTYCAVEVRLYSTEIIPDRILLWGASGVVHAVTFPIELNALMQWVEGWEAAYGGSS